MAGSNSITGGGHYHPSYQSLFGCIALGRTAEYDTGKTDCWVFCKATDIRHGITLSLGNLCKGYAFASCGHIFRTSAAAYLCEELSSDSVLNQSSQRSIAEKNNPFLAKKVIKRRHIGHIRHDWEEVRLQWMFYVVWNDSTANHGTTYTVWGAKNKALRQARRMKKKELCALHPNLSKKDLNALVSQACSQITDVGTFIGENNMGKILIMCKIALQNNVVPPIDYVLLRSKKIHLFGELLTFERRTYYEN